MNFERKNNNREISMRLRVKQIPAGTVIQCDHHAGKSKINVMICEKFLINGLEFNGYIIGPKPSAWVYLDSEKLVDVLDVEYKIQNLTLNNSIVLPGDIVDFCNVTIVDEGRIESRRVDPQSLSSTKKEYLRGVVGYSPDDCQDVSRKCIRVYRPYEDGFKNRKTEVFFGDIEVNLVRSVLANQAEKIGD